ncbi:MAG: Gfo/Idh/MocA family oxidoreductase [Candidatus Riflebacteria bacterium]|nr:Gfo/Idh/MocA family oxidoreductase [Candidatus Riflebacteria bacterium]
MRVLRMGLLGCAAIARRFVLPTWRSLPGFEVRCLASRDGAKSRAWADEFGGTGVEGYTAALERDDVDAVYVPLPPALHSEWITKALEYGKHVVAEKPLAVNLPETLALTALAAGRRLVLMEHLQFRFHRQLAFMRSAMADGRIGTMRHLRSSFGFPPLQEGNFRYVRSLGGGALLDAGVYPLCAAQLLLGPGAQVRGAVMSFDERLGVDLHGAALVAGEGGVAASLVWGFENFYQCSIDLWGSSGRLVLERAFTAPPGLAPRLVHECQGERTEIVLPPDDHFANLWREFHRMVEAGDGAGELIEIETRARLVHQTRQLAGPSPSSGRSVP